MSSRGAGVLRVSVFAVERKKGDASDLFFVQGELGSMRVPPSTTETSQDLVELPAQSSLFACSQLNFFPLAMAPRSVLPTAASTRSGLPPLVDATTSSSSSSTPMQPTLIDVATSPLVLHVYRAFATHEQPRKIGVVQFWLDGLPTVHRTVPFGPTFVQAWKSVGNKKSSKLAGELRFAVCFSEFRSLVALRGAWDALSAGGCLDYPSWTDCPQYSLVVDQACLVSVYLHAVRDDAEHSPTLVCYVLYLGPCPASGRRTRRLDHDDIRRSIISHIAITSKKGTSDPELRGHLDLDAGQYVLLPCTSVPRVIADFSLGVSVPCSVAYSLQPIAAADADLATNSNDEDDDISASVGRLNSSRRRDMLPPWLSAVPVSSSLHSPLVDLDGLMQTMTSRGAQHDPARPVVTCSSLLEAVVEQQPAEIDRHLALLLAKTATATADQSNRSEQSSNSSSSSSDNDVDDEEEEEVDFPDDSSAVQDADGNTVLALAVLANNSDLLRSLLAVPAVAGQLDVCDHYGLTPLMKCAILNRPKCSKLLIKAGANVLIEDARRETASFKAAVLGRIETSKQLISATDRRGRGSARNLFMSPKQASEDWTAVKLGLSKPPASSFCLKQHSLGAVEPFFQPSRVLNVFETITETDTREHASFFQLLSLNGEIMSAVLLFAMKRGDTPDPLVVEATAEGHIEILRVLAKRGDLPPSYVAVSKLASVTPLFYDVVPAMEFHMLVQQRTMRKHSSPDDAHDSREYRDMKEFAQIYLPLLVHEQKMSFLLDGAEAVSYIRVSADSADAVSKDCALLQIRSVAYQDRTKFFQFNDWEVSARGAKARKMKIR